MSMQKGVAMTEELFKKMSERERNFWHSFFDEADKFIRLCRGDEKSEPYNPTSSLQKKYEMAIRDYDGKKYCQIKQLESAISFNRVQVHSAN